MSEKPSVVIVGLDSATWDLLHPWMAEGRMPNIARLVREGVSGRLDSVMPPITPPAWTTFQTGKNPGKHGIFNFADCDPRGNGIQYANATARRTPTLWKLLNAAGISTGTANVPFTYPPEPLDGFQISGMDTPSEKSEFVHPPALRAELEASLGALGLDVRYLEFMSANFRPEVVVEGMRQQDEQWTRAALHLIEHHPQDVMMFVFMSIDTVQHFFWQYMDEGHFRYDPARADRYGHAIRDVYERLDGSLGRIMERLPPETTVLAVSDHGAGPVSDRVVYLNRYLAQLGLLYYRPRTGRSADGPLRKAIRAAVHLLKRSIPPRRQRWLARLVPGLRGMTTGAGSALADIDWSRTKAWCSEMMAAPPSVWINLQGVRPEGIVPASEYEALVDSIIEQLRALKDPRTGEPIIGKVYRRSEIFHGPLANEGADLVLDWWSADSRFSTQPSLPEEADQPVVKVLERKPAEGAEWGGTHRLEGIFVGRGPALKAGAAIAGARLSDMAPTLLRLLGQSVPADMDGVVLTEIFTPEFLASHPAQKGEGNGSSAPGGDGYTAAEATQVEQRLKSLGYLE